MSAEYSVRLEGLLAQIGSVLPVIPAQRALYKAGFPFSKEPFHQQLSFWDHVWRQSGQPRAQLHAYFFLEQYVPKKELHGLLWEASAAWQDHVVDWGLCDALAKINTKVLESLPEQVYPVLVSWNKDANLWKRRQSVVSLLYYSRTKKSYLPFGHIVSLVQPLLTDSEYYVQKGVGWTLREMYTVYPAETWAFLKGNIRFVSAIAFTIAIEKMDDARKNELKGMRK